MPTNKTPTEFFIDRFTDRDGDVHVAFRGEFDSATPAEPAYIVRVTADRHWRVPARLIWEGEHGLQDRTARELVDMYDRRIRAVKGLTIRVA